jgi:hypothetical protein
MRNNPTAEKGNRHDVNHAHHTLRITPAMQAGLADHVWEIEELVALLD